MIPENDNETSWRKQILEDARFLFQTKGFENTSVSVLLERLQMSEQLFFSHFESIDELLEVVWSES